MFKLCRRECSTLIQRMWRHVYSGDTSPLQTMSYSILPIGGDTDIIYINSVPHRIVDIDDSFVLDPSVCVNNGIIFEWHQFSIDEFSFLSKYFSLDTLTDVSLLCEDNHNACMEDNQAHFSLYAMYNGLHALDSKYPEYRAIISSGFNVRIIRFNAIYMAYIRFHSIDEYLRFKLMIDPSILTMKHDLLFTQAFLDKHVTN